MTATEYAAEVTEQIHLAAGPDFEFPSSFDADVAVYFQRRETPEAAAGMVLGMDEVAIRRARDHALTGSEPETDYAALGIVGDEWDDEDFALDEEEV